MPVYRFRGLNAAGQVVAGLRAAPSRDALALALRREQIRLTRAEEKRSPTLWPLAQRVSDQELAVATRQLSVMVDAGLPLLQCLEILSQQQRGRTFRNVLEAVRMSVEAGSTLSAALAEHPQVFDPLFVHLVEAGETGGILDNILRRLALYIEKKLKLKRQVKSALVYPVAVIIVATLVIVLLLWKVVPVFASLFASMNAELPLPTRLVIAASHFVGGMGGLLVGTFVFLLAGALGAWYRTPPGRLALDALLLRLPLVGVLLRKIAVARFTRTLGTLLASGVPILEGLTITAKTSGNAVVEQAVLRVRQAVEIGRAFADPLRGSSVFPAMVAQMIEVGEQTGALDHMLEKIADFYEEEVDAAVRDLLAVLEPAMIVFLGAVVGGIVVSMYLPLFSLIAKLSG
jgi:type IV pilus assembly protein PilC